MPRRAAHSCCFFAVADCCCRASGAALQEIILIKSSSERSAFSARLRQCLRDSNYSPDSPTELAREFNLRFAGRSITVHAARKWLMGEAMPTQDKMRTLAQWLQVRIEWLRFGGEAQPVSSAESIGTLRSSDLKFIADWRLLDESHRQIAREFIHILLRNYRRRVNSEVLERPLAPIISDNS